MTLCSRYVPYIIPQHNAFMKTHPIQTRTLWDILDDSDWMQEDWFPAAPVCRRPATISHRLAGNRDSKKQSKNKTQKEGWSETVSVGHPVKPQDVTIAAKDGNITVTTRGKRCHRGHHGNHGFSITQSTHVMPLPDQIDPDSLKASVNRYGDIELTVGNHGDKAIQCCHGNANTDKEGVLNDDNVKNNKNAAEIRVNEEDGIEESVEVKAGTSKDSQDETVPMETMVLMETVSDSCMSEVDGNQSEDDGNQSKDDGNQSEAAGNQSEADGKVDSMDIVIIDEDNNEADAANNNDTDKTDTIHNANDETHLVEKSQTEPWSMKVSLPGFNPHDLHIKVKDGTVTVAAEHKEENQEEGTYFHNKFHRQFTIPTNVVAERLQSYLAENGDLKLTAPLKSNKDNQIELTVQHE